ncbi:hypothetical protein ACQY0O_006141 [Thecaphora frezii]
MSLDHPSAHVIEISSSSSAPPSPVYHANGRHDDDEPMEARRVSAASRVSLANLLGPTGPGSSPYTSPPRSSPRKRHSDVHPQPPPICSSPTGSTAAAAMATTEKGTTGRSTYPDILGESSRSPPRRQSGTYACADGGNRPPAPTSEGGRNEDGAAASEASTAARADEAPAGDVDDGNASSDGGSASDAGETSRAQDTSKVKKRSRRRSPSPPEPVTPLGPPPRPTIRLSLTEGKKDGYLVNVPNLVYAQLKTQKHPWAEWFESQMEVVDEAPPVLPDAPPGMGDIGGLARLLAKYPSQSGISSGDSSKKRRRRAVEDDAYDIGTYDTKDPFVDDSELGVDEPTHFAKPKADGFYVTQGPVELARIKPSKSRNASGFGPGGGGNREKAKPLSIRDAKSGFAGSINKLIAKRAQLTTNGPAAAPLSESAPDAASNMQLKSLLNSNPNGDGGTADAAGAARSTSTPSRSVNEGSRESPIKVDEIDENAPRPKKARYPTRPVDPRLQAAFGNLKSLVAKESFAVKTKFPPTLKPPLIETAKLAVELGEYNDNFFNYLPTIFPYNRFTMMKLTKREFFPHHIAYFKELQDEHMETLGNMIRESFPQQKAEYEAAHKAWEDRGGPEQEAEGPQANGRDGTAMDVDGAAAPLTEEELQEPQKRWKWTEEMREEVYTLINIENAMSEVRNEKLKLENAPEQFSEINARKSCYKKMAELFPEEGWTTSTNISREYAQLKKKKDRQEARMGAEMDDSRAGSFIA